MRKGQAQKVFNEELAGAGTSMDYDDFSVSESAHRDAWNEEYWKQTDNGRGETARTLAYFRAYLRIAKNDLPIAVDDRLPAGGIRLEPKGRMRMDKFVIGTMLKLGYLRFEGHAAGLGEPAFFLTQAGQEWIEKK